MSHFSATEIPDVAENDLANFLRVKLNMLCACLIVMAIFPRLYTILETYEMQVQGVRT